MTPVHRVSWSRKSGTWNDELGPLKGSGGLYQVTSGGTCETSTNPSLTTSYLLVSTQWNWTVRILFEVKINLPKKLQLTPFLPELPSLSSQPIKGGKGIYSPTPWAVDPDTFNIRKRHGIFPYGTESPLRLVETSIATGSYLETLKNRHTGTRLVNW